MSSGDSWVGLGVKEGAGEGRGARLPQQMQNKSDGTKGVNRYKGVFE